MKLDLSQLITAEAKADALRTTRAEAARAECARRIVALAPPSTQINLAAAAAGGLLSKEEAAAYRAALVWIGAMRGTWAGLAEAGLDPADPRHWPAPPEGLAALVQRY